MNKPTATTTTTATTVSEKTISNTGRNTTTTTMVRGNIGGSSNSSRRCVEDVGLESLKVNPNSQQRYNPQGRRHRRRRRRRRQDTATTTTDKEEGKLGKGKHDSTSLKQFDGRSIDDVLVSKTRRVTTTATNNNPSSGKNKAPPQPHGDKKSTKISLAGGVYVDADDDSDDAYFFYGDDQNYDFNSSYAFSSSYGDEEWTSDYDDDDADDDDDDDFLRPGAMRAGPEGHRQLTKGILSMHPGSFDGGSSEDDSVLVSAFDNDVEYGERQDDSDKLITIGSKFNKKRMVMLLAVGILVVVAVVVISLVVMTGKNKASDTNNDQGEHYAEYLQLRLELQSKLAYLSSDPEVVFNDPNTPQSMAIQWLIQNDTTFSSMNVTTEDNNNVFNFDDENEEQHERRRLVTRYSLAVLYYSTMVKETTKPKLNDFLSPTLHECNWTRAVETTTTTTATTTPSIIVCDSSSQIIEINLGKNKMLMRGLTRAHEYSENLLTTSSFAFILIHINRW